MQVGGYLFNGIINVYKEKGFTSFDVVAKLRGIAGQRKIGHTGTLDPDAEGVLPICLGNATKLCDMLTDKDKEYVATFKLGYRTDTLDSTGNILETKDVLTDADSIRRAIEEFRGGYNQVPPMYSAKWVDGKRLYDLARDGIEIERKPVWVNIYELEVVSVDLPYVEIRVVCGKGTYIRSLCSDIAAKCGELATMTGLVRTRVQNWKIENAYKLSDLQKMKDEGRLDSCVLPTDFFFQKLRKAVTSEEGSRYLANGNKLTKDMLSENCWYEDKERIRVYSDCNTFGGIYEFDAKKRCLIPYKMFLTEVDNGNT